MILDMKKATIYCMQEDQEQLLKKLQQFGWFMPEERGAQSSEASETKARLARAQRVYNQSNAFRKKKGFLASRTTAGEEELLQRPLESEELVRNVEKLLEERQSLQEEEKRIRDRLAALDAWKGLDVSAESMRANLYTAYITGFAKETQLPRLVEKLGDDVTITTAGQRGDNYSLVCVCSRDDLDSVMQTLRENGFEPENIPVRSGYLADEIASVQEQLRTCTEKQQTVQAKLEELCAHDAEMEKLLESESAAYAREEIGLEKTLHTVCLRGWVPENHAKGLLRAVHSASENAIVTLDDPAEDEEVPTCTQNNRFVKPFEAITDMFAIPNYGKLDPNPVMSVWYWLIFGMMMADAGYGLILLVFGFLFKKLKKPTGAMGSIVDIFLYGSFSTMIFGILFGSYFGETFHPILFSPMTSPMKMLIFSIIVGVLHLFSGMILDLVQKARDGHVWDGIFDDVSWMALLCGIGMIFLKPVRIAGMILAGIGALTILLTAGRAKKGFFGKVTGGFGGLYNITGFLSDILSYSRILALGMATAVIGMVMNMLAGLVQGSIPGFIASVVIYIIGHAFNLVMGLLSAYVHDSRLQYIEFFGKFYEGGGEEFKPLTFSKEYVDIVAKKEEAKHV